MGCIRARALVAGSKRFLGRNAWVWLAGALALAGSIGSVLGAVSVGRDDAQRASSAFRLSAQQVASNLKLRIQQENDLLVSGGAFFAETRDANAARFRAWVHDVQAFKRSAELVGVAEVVAVRGDRLASWQARVAASPPLAGLQAPFRLSPPGARPHYCLIAAAVALVAPDIGADDCALAPQLYKSRSTGVTYDSVIQRSPMARFFGASMPVYRGGSVPGTVAGRRAAFVGWIVLIIRPQGLLAGALDGHPGMGVVLRRGPDGTLSFAAGRAPGGARRFTFALPGGSTVEVLGAVAGASVFKNANALVLLFGGIALSWVLAALAFTLGTGRARAMRLVAVKTSQLAFQALHDSLTELPNRALVLDRAERALARAARSRDSAAALFIDVDGFKAINDGFGHAAGDELLRVVAARLRGAVRDSDTVGRVGGDEFVVLLEPHDLYVAPKLVAERVLAVLREPVSLDGAKKVSVTASIGIAVWRGESADELLRNADLALYAAKAEGKNRFVVFEDSMQLAAADRYELEFDLQGALDANQLFLLYQPTFDLENGTVHSVEALIRWKHPSRGVVPPGVFIPIAEESALIVEIGRWVLREACAQASAWHDQGYHVGISVNLSARQLEDDEFIDEVAEVLAASRLAPGALTLEITETLLMRDPESAAGRLRALKLLGVRIAIDDFGTGYSSLAYLRQFPVDALKIDRSFISGISSSNEAAALMQMLVQLGKTLGLDTLGEGIEEQSQLERLRREHCDYGQGFLLARPLPVEDVQGLLTRTSGFPARRVRGPATHPARRAVRAARSAPP